MAKAKQKKEEESRAACFGTFVPPGDDFCDNECNKEDREACEKESDEEVFELGELQLDDEDERVETLSALTNDQLIAVAEFYEIDVGDEAGRNEFLLAIDEHFDNSDNDSDEDQEDDEDLDEYEGQDDEDEDDSSDPDDKDIEILPEGAELDLLEESIRELLAEITKPLQGICEAVKEYTEWLDSDDSEDDGSDDEDLDDSEDEDSDDAEDDDDPDDSDEDLDDPEEDDEDDKQSGEPDYFRLLAEENGCKVTEVGNKVAAKKGRTYWASLLYSEEKVYCYLVFNNGNSKRLPGTTLLKEWESHPCIDAFHKDAEKLLKRHFADKSK